MEVNQMSKRLRKPYVNRVIIKHEIDCDPDLSWIGEFSMEPCDGAIDHQERCNGNHRVLRFFNPANPEYAEQEYGQMMAYERGDWSMMGISAIAEIHIPVFRDNWISQRIHSGGIWGVESNSTNSEIDNFDAEQISELKEVLKSLGIKWNYKLIPQLEE